MTSEPLLRSSSKERQPFAPNSFAAFSTASRRGSVAATSSTRSSRASVGAVSANARPRPTTPSLSFLTAREYDLLRRLSKRDEAFARRERPAVPRRGRCAHGRHHAQPLAAGVPVGGGGGEGRRPGALPPARRRSGGLQRFERQARCAERVLPPSPRLARLRPQRRVRPALPLPW